MPFTLQTNSQPFTPIGAIFRLGHEGQSRSTIDQFKLNWIRFPKNRMRISAVKVHFLCHTITKSAYSRGEEMVDWMPFWLMAHRRSLTQFEALEISKMDWSMGNVPLNY